MKFDGQIDIAIGHTVDTKKWKNKKITWSELVQKLSESRKTSETFKEYMAATKDEQGKIKDVGGYVGGYLRRGMRNPENVVHRQVLTLDIDFAHGEFWDDFQMQFENAAVLHSTHKHHDSSPRFRLVMPLSREVSADEYVAISRRIAGTLNIELFDSTTFETNRLMFWPSNPKDMEYYFRFQDGEWIDADAVLESYTDWKDSSLWPTSVGQVHKIKTSAEKQEDPENKKGIVGAFCRTYSIQESIDKFLSEVYVSSSDGRYSYTKGSTASGLIIYDDKFAFSHHGTDPCSGKLCNSFDLVRIHLFGHLDDDDKGKTSFKAMDDFAREDKGVRKIIASETLQGAKYDFNEELEDDMDIDWMQELEIDSKGKYLSTATNINQIFANDIRLKGLFKKNRFDSRDYVFANLPWRKVSEPSTIENVDLSGIRNYIESIYGINAALKIKDVLNLELERNSFHPIKEYLHKIQWDGVDRVDTLLIDFFGSDDNIYSREAIRKMLVGAVARVFNPGCKFDLVLVLVGVQGCGKSTFIKKLGKGWFSDTFLTVQGKEALEQIQGSWLIEMAELSGLRKAEVEAIKHFISKQEDIFRPAYKETTETFKRQCVFFGTTNKESFLTDVSGNRRFMPVDVVVGRATKSVFTGLEEEEIDQIWAEAVAMFRKGEKLYLSANAEQIAKKEQQSHTDADERAGIIENYLLTLLPKDWYEKDINERRMFLEDPLTKGSIIRDYVCIAELWCECLGKNREDMDRYRTREINDIMRSFEGWEQSKSTRNFGPYGKQKYFTRKLD